MGTSTSSKGRDNKSPLVPEHADTDPDKPLPDPEKQKFRGFRTEFGRAVSRSGGGSFPSALGKYARHATGGSSVAPRRFGPAYTAGASLYGVLNELRNGGTAEEWFQTDLTQLENKPLSEAIETIALMLAPNNKDAEQIRIAVQEALAEVLPETDTFEPASLNSDEIISVLVHFFSQILFLEITNDAGNAWTKAEDAARAIEAENELFDLINTSVDKHLGAALVNGPQNMSRDQTDEIQKNAVREIWAEWERIE